MRVKEGDMEDRYGQPICIKVSGSDATPQKIYDYLWNHGYQGYKFIVIIDTTQPEYEIPEKETPVYFMDTLFEELCAYRRANEMAQWLKDWLEKNGKKKVIENDYK